ncbi:pilus assembly protein Flp/PilA [Burkholderia multivorans]
MSKIILKVKQFLRDQDGVTAIEYGLIASLIGVAIIGGAYTVGTDLNSVFNKIGADL